MSRADRPGRTYERTPEERERDRAEREQRRREPPLPPSTGEVPLAAHAPSAATAEAPASPEAPAPPERAQASGGGAGEGRSVRNGARLGRGGTGGTRVRRRGITRARLGAVAALALAAAVAWFSVSLFQPFAGAGSGSVIVEIPKGSSASKIGSILARHGVVASGFFFEVRALLEGKRGELHSGRFKLRRDMTYAAAIDALSKPPPALIAVKLVIPEGFSRLQISRLAQADALKGSYLAATQRSSLLAPSRYGAPAHTASLEGFLFPATYDLVAGAPVARLVRLQLQAFRQRFGVALVRRARSLGVTPYGLLTIASMVEREAQVPRDRPLIAAVIYNRLRRGMPLGVDATVYYALALREGPAAYERQLTASDLLIESPYNTRRHAGLPPTPISNPGLASIDAGAHPARVGYLYYVAAPDGCGEHRFSATESRFQADVAAYRGALAKHGGHLPACSRR